MGRLPDWFLDSFLKVIIAGLIILLIKAAQIILGSELHHFFEAIKSEIRDAANRAWTVGSINGCGFVGMAIFGIVVIVASTGQKIFGLSFSQIIGSKKADELTQYTNYMSLFFVLGLYLVISLICVVIDNRRK
jgi:hypothetical protein